MVRGFVFCASLGIGLIAGCGGISVAPSCPGELRVGESGTLQANETHAGAVPTYKWEAAPSDSVALESPTTATTKIEALKAGEVVVRLTASDSLYQVVSECRLIITAGGNPEVSLVVEPSTIEVGESAVLFCASTGDVDAVVRTLEQVDGPVVTLDPLSEGVATVTPDQAGELTFRCVGKTGDGTASEPSLATLTVEAAQGDSDNDNTGGRPPRGGDRSGRG